MGVLVKTVHLAITEGKDPRVEVNRRLLNYHTTPHPSTGKAPYELMAHRKLRTKVLVMIQPAKGKATKEAQQMDKKTRHNRKLKRDKKRGQWTRRSKKETRCWSNKIKLQLILPLIPNQSTLPT